jgi:uncharacterized protein (TIGR02757 family)
VPLRRHAERLDALYARYNRRRYVEPDPLQFLYAYEAPCDREVAALVASSLALGRVKSILASVRTALAPLGPHPCRWLRRAREEAIRRRFAGFRHRFLSGDDLASLLVGARRAIGRHGSLHAAFARHLGAEDETVVPALEAFVRELSEGGRRGGGRAGSARAGIGHLLPDPARGSACKRLMLFLRWLVRSDEVDPGGWDGVPAAKLVAPLDVHMHRIGRALGATRRRSADLRAALEVTEAFRAIAPDDPVRYDFALTRLGIRDDADAEAFLACCGAAEAVS